MLLWLLLTACGPTPEGAPPSDEVPVDEPVAPEATPEAESPPEAVTGTATWEGGAPPAGSYLVVRLFRPSLKEGVAREEGAKVSIGDPGEPPADWSVRLRDLDPREGGWRLEGRIEHEGAPLWVVEEPVDLERFEGIALALVRTGNPLPDVQEAFDPTARPAEEWTSSLASLWEDVDACLGTAAGPRVQATWAASEGDEVVVHLKDAQGAWVCRARDGAAVRFDMSDEDTVTHEGQPLVVWPREDPPEGWTARRWMDRSRHLGWVAFPPAPPEAPTAP